jgi:hypothetical protein
MYKLVAFAVLALTISACGGSAGGQSASPPASPTGQDPAVKQYQTMVGLDDQRAIRFLQGLCTPPDSVTCPDEIPIVIAELQQWLDDLNRSQPPDKFAAADGQMRSHLALAIADLNALAAAIRGKDQNGMTTALAAALGERDTVDHLAFTVTSSS